MNESFPGCVGYHGRPLPPNVCETCPCESLCRKVVSKARLKIILEKVIDAERTLSGDSDV